MASLRPQPGSDMHCRFYSTPIGCRNGDKCKFLHATTASGVSSSPTSEVICKYFALGSCKRGDQCWYKHEKPTGSAADVSGAESTPVQTSTIPAGTESQDDICCICQEKPKMYGLLENCSHICCLDCLRGWRRPTGKSQEIIDSGTTKKCPYCRTPSSFVTPSRVFYSSNDPRKSEIIADYKASRARIPCKYFQRSRPGRRQCPFGRDCFYQHIEEDGTPYVFPLGADHYLSRIRERVRNENGLLFGTRSRNSQSEWLPVLLEIVTRLSSLQLFSQSDEHSSETDVIMSRIVGDVISSLEETVESATPSTSTEDHDDSDLHYQQPLLPSIFATSDDVVSPRLSDTSPLPLTRASVDSINEDNPDSHAPFHFPDWLRSQAFPPTLLLEVEELMNTTEFEVPYPFSNRSEQSEAETSDDEEIILGNHLLSEVHGSSSSRVPQGSNITGVREDRQNEVRQSSTHLSNHGSGSEPIGPGILSSSKPNGPSQTHRHRRSTDQAASFVTDGRGRVVATADSSDLDGNSAWFWDSGNGIPQSTSGSGSEEGESLPQASVSEDGDDESTREGLSE